MSNEIKEYENMDLIGQLTIQGNIPCVFCGKGDECETSAFKMGMFDPGTKASDIKYAKVEDQNEVWEEAIQIGRLMGERLQ